MSIKAMNWAMEQATGDPRAQCLLYVIADTANEEGIAWPGADWMAAKSQQSRATVYRRLDALQELGLMVIFPRWIDDAGKIWNTAATGRRRTSPEIRLQFGVLIKQVAPSEEPENEAETAGPPSQPETGVSQRSDGAVSPERRGSSHCSDTKNHLLNQEDSPQPPSGGTVDLEGWKDFEDDWAEPILRQSFAQQVWASLSTEERSLARSAARGYFAHRKTQKNPPNVIGAHLFLRERDAWPKFAERDPGKPQAVAGGSVPVDSVEAKAITALYAVARVQPLEIQRRIVYPAEITPQLRAFAEAPPNGEWLWIDAPRQIGAWSNFLGQHVKRARPPLVVTRGLGEDQRSGIYAPWPWPPGKEGQIYTATDPPGAGLSDEELADFK